MEKSRIEWIQDPIIWRAHYPLLSTQTSKNRFPELSMSVVKRILLQERSNATDKLNYISELNKYKLLDQFTAISNKWKVEICQSTF